MSIKSCDFHLNAILLHRALNNLFVNTLAPSQMIFWVSHMFWPICIKRPNYPGIGFCARVYHQQPQKTIQNSCDESITIFLRLLPTTSIPKRRFGRSDWTFRTNWFCALPRVSLIVDTRNMSLISAQYTALEYYTQMLQH